MTSTRGHGDSCVLLRLFALILCLDLMILAAVAFACSETLFYPDLYNLIPIQDKFLLWIWRIRIYNTHDFIGYLGRCYELSYLSDQELYE